MLEIQFGSGFGDILNVIFSRHTYVQLEDISSDERVSIHLLSQNPYVKELFLWHPKSAQFSVHTHGLCTLPNMSDHESWPPFDQTKLDRWLGFYSAARSTKNKFYIGSSGDGLARFYPSPRDTTILNRLRGTRFALVCASAGSLNRNIPSSICNDVVSAACAVGVPIVSCGRNYSLPSQFAFARREQELPARSGVLNLIDQLTLPGTLELVRMASAVICCHSSMCLMAWHIRKPVFLLCPPEILSQKPKDSGSREFISWWTSTRFAGRQCANFQEYQYAKLATCPPSILSTNPTGKVALEFISWWFGTSFDSTVCTLFSSYRSDQLLEFLRTYCLS